MDRKEKEILGAMEKLGAAHADEVNASIETAISNVIEQGLAPQEALNIPPKKMEALYTQGYQLYNAGSYKKAGKIFGLLVMLSNTDPRYYMANGACLHKVGRYEEAIQSYGMAASYDPTSPIPLYHAVDCTMEMGDKISTVTLLEMVIQRCRDEEQYSLIKERCKILKEALVNEINEHGLGPGKREKKK